MRDEFSVARKELLAKRVGYRCSTPSCRQPTSGPQEDPSKVINLGVAAHITAASPQGPRYDVSRTPAQRRSAENGIWLCQKCAKLVDNDPARYPVHLLREWKELAEGAAVRDLEHRTSLVGEPERMFEKLEGLVPELLAEMRKDLTEHPLSREFVVLKRSWSYRARGHELAYYLDDHPELENKLLILQNYCLIQNITYNNVARYIITEELASYLH